MWSSFVILAGMRTGSNYLEANLNEYPGIACLGELFNPHFIGHAGRLEAHGTTLAARDSDPLALLHQIRRRPEGLAGFRLFHDHDPRVISAVLDDPAVAKIVLSRNPLDSYVSLRIAQETGQWLLGDMKHARSARIVFDAAEFSGHLAEVRAFQDLIIRRLQETGQTAFFLTYEDVGEVRVMNGLARWLGVAQQRGTTSSRTRKQNPEPLEARVSNHAAMLAALSAADPHDLDRAPVFEPRRGPAVPQMVAAARAPLLYLPLRSGPNRAVRSWMAALDGVGEDRLREGFGQKALRQWQRERPGHRTFAVLRHPVARLYEAFCRHILPGGSGPYSDLRAALARHHRLQLPAAGRVWDAAAQAVAFKAFVRFVHGNLSGQTSLRTDAAWATQLAILQGMAQFALPDHILREDDLAASLPWLAAAIGAKAPPWLAARPAGSIPLADVYDDETEALVRQAHQRDYTGFGFDSWR